MRLNKFLSQSGLASRRAADQMIRDRLVSINGKPAALGNQVDTNKDIVRVNHRIVKINRDMVYIMINKPYNVLSTVTDDRQRRTVVELVKSRERLYPVGRLDYNSTGLLILTNDGDFTLRLTHPRFHLPKTYEVEIDRAIDKSHLEALKQGIILEDGPTLPTQISYQDATGRHFRIILNQGKNRQIRRMFEHFEYRVFRLHRTAIGPLQLGSLNPGQSRPLTPSEVKMLSTDRR